MSVSCRDIVLEVHESFWGLDFAPLELAAAPDRSPGPEKLTWTESPAAALR